MLITYKLKKGETFASVMKKHGVTDWKTSWDLAENKGLKTKRRTADKVEPGDTLTFVDPRAKLHPVMLGGKTYHVPEGDMEHLQDEVKKLIKKVALPRLVKLKEAYDADYERLMDVTAGKEGTIFGIIACAVENLKDAKPPTAEMNAFSKAIKNLQRLFASYGTFSNYLDAMNDLQKAADDYVYAAELYRSKMIKGNEAAVVLFDLTVTGLFIVVSALASGGASLAIKGFTSLELGAATGAATAFLKQAATEIGEFLVGHERTTGQIVYAMVSETMFGAGSSVVSSLLRESKIGTRIMKHIAGKVQERMPDYVDRLMVRGGLVEWDAKLKIFDTIGEDKVAELVSKTLMRASVSMVQKALIAVTSAKDHAEALFDATKRIVLDASGKESAEDIGDKIGAEVATDGLLDAVCDRLMADMMPVIRRTLEIAAEREMAA